MKPLACALAFLAALSTAPAQDCCSCHQSPARQAPARQVPARQVRTVWVPVETNACLCSFGAMCTCPDGGCDCSPCRCSDCPGKLSSKCACSRGKSCGCGQKKDVCHCGNSCTCTRCGSAGNRQVCPRQEVYAPPAVYYPRPAYHRWHHGHCHGRRHRCR